MKRREEVVAVLSDIAKMVGDIRDMFYKLHTEDDDMEDYPEYTSVQTQLFELARSVSAEHGSRVAKDLFKSFEKTATM